MARVRQPPSSWIVRRSTPAIASREAKVCRSPCQAQGSLLEVGGDVAGGLGLGQEGPEDLRAKHCLGLFHAFVYF
jgi:hypothetical protein